MIIKMYVDAATNPRTQISAVGVILVVNQQQYLYKKTLAVTTNHEAEFAATLFGLQCAEPFLAQQTTLMLYADSKIVIDSLTKNYAKHYHTYVHEINAYLTPYQSTVLSWIPEKQNQGAHQLANQALHLKS